MTTFKYYIKLSCRRRRRDFRRSKKHGESEIKTKKKRRSGIETRTGKKNARRGWSLSLSQTLI